MPRRSTIVFGISFYSVAVYKGLTRDYQKDVPLDVTNRYDNTAEGFDSEVDCSEWLMGMNRYRKSLTKLARGHVLETSVGTGRNFPYYNLQDCKSITFVDQSVPMIDIAKKKWEELHLFKRVAFRVQSAAKPVPCPEPEGFDTVIQTMGLCSTPEPVVLLKNMGEMVKQDGGQILLLEHGKSHYQWLDNLLDKTAAAHADKHGCWWNKDIGRIVEDSGLEVVKIKRYNFGTTWWVELKPKARNTQRDDSRIIQSDMQQQTVEKVTQSNNSGWSLWK
ncbi:S-adenosyl-L-methionine-dependent methyltransferase [Patellaria atrata CBS 101060]|uniref:S-adenosyl-L-methionine-dependent methyltransferase n=1 Tax=Patellaria atrata CBS 101060 TaxID=1346257 RepID=A0A9P4VX27_9PEZI|nr:S-adenosyl-L-methionine-dependent methyltransferase [Patellaria atrata CBS 101060]